MEPMVNVEGHADLTEVYRNEHAREYYAVLFIRFDAGEEKNPKPQMRIEVPITERRYNTLKDLLKNKARMMDPFLRVKGNLEIGLDFPDGN